MAGQFAKNEKTKKNEKSKKTFHSRMCLRSSTLLVAYHLPSSTVFPRARTSVRAPSRVRTQPVTLRVSRTTEHPCAIELRQLRHTVRTLVRSVAETEITQLPIQTHASPHFHPTSCKPRPSQGVPSGRRLTIGPATATTSIRTRTYPHPHFHALPK